MGAPSLLSMDTSKTIYDKGESYSKLEGWPDEKLEGTNTFKNKVIVQQSQYTSDGQFRGT